MKERQGAIPVAIYARAFGDRQDLDLSVAEQLRALRDYARKNGYMVVREFVDEAERAYPRQAAVPEDDRQGRQAQGPL